MMTLRTVVALVALALARPSLAGLAVPASVEDLTRTSDVVVRGRVASVSARRSSDGRRVLTYVEVEVSTAWHGNVPQRITVVVPGGVVGNIGQRVEGAPAFSQDEQVVLFLGKVGSTFRVRGLAQGKFSVVSGQAQPDLSGLTFAPGRRLRASERRVEAMGVDELERRVRSVR